MNKKLLLFCSTLLLSVAAFAQSWEKPVPTSREELKLSVEGQDTTIYYLYNRDAQAFYTEGNSWGTQASIGSSGLKVFFTQNEKGSYLFHDYPNTKGKWMLLFFDSATNMFVDHNDQANYFWDIVPGDGEKTYRFRGADENPLYNPTGYPNCFMGYYLSPDNTSTALTANLDMSEVEILDEGEMYCIDWWLISPEAYEEFQPKVLAYDAAKKLEETLEEGEEFYEINLSGAKAVYNNTSSTAAELDSVRHALEAAIECVQYLWEVENEWTASDVKAAVQAAYALLKTGNFSEADVKAARSDVYNAIRKYEVEMYTAGASEENPADITPLMENANFDQGNKDGWDITSGIGNNLQYNYDAGVHDYTLEDGTPIHGHYNPETGAWIQGFIEAWLPTPGKLGNGRISQTIKGLPAGKYSFECDALACNQATSKQENVGVYLFAEGGGVSVTKVISTANERPEHFELPFVSGGGDITLGLMTQNADANWMAADNFVLWFYGEIEDDPYKVILDSKIAEYKKTYPDIDDVAANQEVKDDYSATLAAAEECEEGFIEMDSLLATKVEALAKSVADYKRLETMLEDLMARAEAFEGNTDFPDLAGILADYHQNLLEAYEDRIADAALIDTVQATVGKLIVDEITENLKPGVELTPLIFNPAFDTDFDSWSTTGARPGFGGKGGQGPNDLGDVKTITESGCAEVYHAAFDMFQIVRNMPKGSFKLTAQAFERYDGANDNDARHPNFVDYWEQNPVKGNDLGHNAVLYANTYEKKLPNILAYATPEPLYTRYQYNEDGTIKINDDGTEAKEWYSDSDQSSVTNGGFVPNSMDGANFHFTSSPDVYLAEVNFSVKEDGDSIRVGLKIATTRSWVIFDNFRLFYNGNDASAYKDAIDKLMAELNGVFTGDNVVIYGKDAVTKVDAAKEALNAAVASNDGDVCAAALDQGYEALEYAKTSITDYAALDEAYNQLGADIEEYSDIAPASTLAKANELYDNIEKALLAQDKTNEEVEYMIDRAAYYGAAFKVPDTEGASIDNPIDLTEMIINSSFDVQDDWTGWSGSSWGSGGQKSTSAERYSMGFDTYQDIAGLPAGNYVVYFQAFYRHGSSTADYAKFSGEEESTLEAYFYATSSVETAEMPVLYCSSGRVPTGTSWINGDTSGSGSGYVMPNTMLSFGAWCEQIGEEVTPLDKYTYGAIYYNHLLQVKVGEDGKLRIGAKKTGNVDADWFICDNFRLFYIGTEGPDPAIDSAIKGVELDNNTIAAKAIYNLAGQKLAAPVKGFNIINGKKYFVK